MLPSNTYTVRFGVKLHHVWYYVLESFLYARVGHLALTPPSLFGPFLFLTYFSLHPLPHPTPPSILFLVVLLPPSSSSPFYLRVCVFICVCMFVCVKK